MGQANVRKSAKAERFLKLDQELKTYGIDTTQLGFYDQPKFLEQEAIHADFVENYAEWVTLKPHGKSYAEHVKTVVPQLVKLVHAEFVEFGLDGGCVAASGMITRMLDRLGVWSFAVGGSVTLEVERAQLRRMLHAVDRPDFPGAMLGHVWVVAPPYTIVDSTISLQHWQNDEMGHFVPPYVLAADDARMIRPKVGDVVSDQLRREAAAHGIPDADLHYRLEPRLQPFGRKFPALEISRGDLTLHYVPVVVRQTDVPLERINIEGERGRPAIEFWQRIVAPHFNV